MAFDPVATTIDEAQKQGIDPQLALNVLWQESHKQGGAVSSKGAKGYMQLMPAAARDMGVNRNDPEANIRGGVQYLAQQIRRFGSNELGAAAYNAGPKAVQQYGGVPPYKETQAYVASVIPQTVSGAGGSSPVGSSGQDKVAADPGYDPTIFAAPGSPAASQPAQGPKADPGYDPTIFAAPAVPAGPAAPAPSSPAGPPQVVGDVLDSDTGAAITNPAQVATAEKLRPIIDSNAPRGSAQLPYYLKNNSEINNLKVGDYYIDTDGNYRAKGDYPGVGVPLEQEIASDDRIKQGQKTALNWLENLPVVGGAVKAAAGPVSAISNGIDDFSQGVTAPFAPSIAGFEGWAGQGLYNLGARALGQPVNVTAGQRGEAASIFQRAAQAQRNKSDPLLSYGGQVLGGAAMAPVMEAGVATNIASKAPGWLSGALDATPAWLKAIATNAGVGAGYGAVSAPDGDRLHGAEIGGATGAVLTPAIAMGAKALSPVLAPLGTSMKSIGAKIMPDAATNYADALAATGNPSFAAQFPTTTSVPAGVDPATAQQSASYISSLANWAKKTPTGAPIGNVDLSTLASSPADTTAEALGQTGINAAAAIARKPGTTGDAALDLFSDRASSRPDRFLSTFQNITGVDPAATRGDIDAIVANGRTAAAPKYQALYDDPTQYTNNNIQAVYRTPIGQKALSDTYVNALNDPFGPQPQELGLVQTPSGQIAMSPDGLTAQGHDLVKKTLAQSVSRDGFGRPIPDSQDMGNQAINNANKYLTGELRDLIPGYADALDTSGDYLSQQQAYNNGQGLLFNRSVSPADVTSLMTNNTDAQTAAMKAAMGNDLYMRAQNGNLRAADLANPNTNAKLSAMFGPDAASQLSDFANSEAAMLPAERLIPPSKGSQTYVLAANGTEPTQGVDPSKILSDAGAGIVMGRPPVHSVMGAIVKNLTGAYDPAAMSIQTMPLDVRNEVGRILLGSPSDAADYLAGQLPSSADPSATSIAQPSNSFGLFGSGLNTILSGTGLQ